jgi:hypothetical protein
MKTAVDRIGRGKAQAVNARFNAMTNHYLFEATFCNPASSWEKGPIEKLASAGPIVSSAGRKHRARTAWGQHTPTD